MPLWTCEQCGAQFPESAAPPPACPVCEDDRQYVTWTGQTWPSIEQMAKRQNLVWREDFGILGIAPSPIRHRAAGAAGARGRWRPDVGLHLALVTRPPSASPGLAGGGDRRLASALLQLGGRLERGVRRRAGLPARRRPACVTRPDRLEPWTGDNHRFPGDLLLFRTGGHFAGGTIMHWRRGSGRAGCAVDRRLAMVARTAGRSPSCTAFRTTSRSMPKRCAGSLMRVPGWCSTAFMASGGAATSARMPGRHSIGPSGDISRRFRMILAHDPETGYRFSEQIMRKLRRESGVAI